ncbi:hypothetical protein BDZ89DRAFT_1034535 [Hymenopellis radicata]|nr:hypothetical protein BDZ89DRAFT_1034535 [Hymenopellis radicata]
MTVQGITRYMSRGLSEWLVRSSKSLKKERVRSKYYSLHARQCSFLLRLLPMALITVFLVNRTRRVCTSFSEMRPETIGDYLSARNSLIADEHASKEFKWSSIQTKPWMKDQRSVGPAKTIDTAS